MAVQQLDLVESLSKKSYEFALATEKEKAWLDSEMGILARQRMNLRTVPSARFLLLKTETGAIIGWAGFDTERPEAYPEIFSLHLDPKYRGGGLGLLLEYARSHYVLAHGVRLAYVRMDREKSYALLRKRLESRFYTEAPIADLKADYVAMCNGCELFRTSCRQQVFLKFDIVNFIEHVEGEFGPLDIGVLPRRFTPSLLGTQRKPVESFAGWSA